MYYLRTEDSFDAAHFLWGYEGKCRNIHGHRWRVVVEIKSTSLVKEGQMRGMIVDFGDLKKDVKALCDYFDHSLIYETGSLKPATLTALSEENFNVKEVGFRPTAENFSEYFFTELKKLGYNPHRVEVYETPNNCAVYEDD
ncbi:MAG: 6-carboxytetrahydropterin synthase QueD [Clostridia bacterium]|nr:6-carboxytetrahydropterin synthase QueD [Clostridia bacterium]